MLKFTVVPIQLEKDPLPIAEREAYCGDNIFYNPPGGMQGGYGPGGMPGGYGVGEMPGGYGAGGMQGGYATGYAQEAPKEAEKKKADVSCSDVMTSLGVDKIVGEFF